MWLRVVEESRNQKNQCSGNLYYTAWYVVLYIRDHGGLQHTLAVLVRYNQAQKCHPNASKSVAKFR